MGGVPYIWGEGNAWNAELQLRVGLPAPASLPFFPGERKGGREPISPAFPPEGLPVRFSWFWADVIPVLEKPFRLSSSFLAGFRRIEGGVFFESSFQ